MVVKPKIRGFICTTSHPTGCDAAVKAQIDYVKAQPKTEGAKKVLVIGSSMGYGLASRISAAFSCGAATIGVIFDKQGSDSRTGSAGWYNTAAFEKYAHAEGLYAKTINGDAFSQEIKNEVIDLIRNDLGKVDMVIYSLAAPRRTLADGTSVSSVLKTTGGSYTNKSIDLKNMKISDVTIDPATDEEIDATVKVMGGEDWIDWIKQMKEAGVLEDGALTLAYSYIGPEITHPMYFNGSIGRAKADLYASAKKITAEVEGVNAYVSVNKALVTQSSSAIPIVPLYISILYKVMKEENCHEGCIEQMQRMFAEKLYNGGVKTDSEGLIRMDDWEMREDIQKKVSELWDKISDENLADYADIAGYQQEFSEIFGFGLNGVDYDADVDPAIGIESIG
ncbi:MAG: trans-2-enoyl-CoA reductase family protein [Oscillospiraceae bacterium]|nr:trans-2-enoyl-CoA reductase family protein [Oscillospiraceae bacterium]